MEYILPLLSFSYWFGTAPQPFLPVVNNIVLIVLYGLLVAGGACGFYAKFGKKLEKDLKRLLRDYSSALTTAGAVGLLLYAFTWQRVPFLSMRFFFVIWAALFGYWIWTIARYQINVLPEKRQLREEQAERNKWLPTKKK